MCETRKLQLKKYFFEWETNPKPSWLLINAVSLWPIS